MQVVVGKTRKYLWSKKRGQGSLGKPFKGGHVRPGERRPLKEAREYQGRPRKPLKGGQQSPGKTFKGGQGMPGEAKGEQGIP